MKHIFISLLALVLIFTLCACSGNSVTTGESANTGSAVTTDGASDTAKADDTAKPDETQTNADNVSENAETAEEGKEQGAAVDNHVHTYGEWTTVSDATCTEGAAKEHVCTVCGAKQTVYGVPAGHKMKDNVCEICGRKASEGLAMLDYRTCYYVSGIGECKDNDIIIPDTYEGKPVTGIEEKAFKNNTDITSVTFQEGVVEIGSEAFYNCFSLKNVYLSDSLEKISAKAFSFCDDLFTITLPENLTSIYQKAFLACDRLIEINNKSSLSLTINSGSDNNGGVASDAVSVISDGDFHVYKTDDGYYYYDYNGITYLLAYTGTETELVLPSDFNGNKYDIITTAFSGNETLKSVVIREGTEVIRPQAFMNCKALETVVFPSTLKQINNDAFRNCTSISSVSYNGTKDEWKKVDINSGNDPAWDREITFLGK